MSSLYLVLLSAACTSCLYFTIVWTPLKTKDRLFDNFVATGGPVSCHSDNLRCHQWRKRYRNDDVDAKYMLRHWFPHFMYGWYTNMLKETAKHQGNLHQNTLILSIKYFVMTFANTRTSLFRPQWVNPKGLYYWPRRWFTSDPSNLPAFRVTLQAAQGQPVCAYIISQAHHMRYV